MINNQNFSQITIMLNPAILPVKVVTTLDIKNQLTEANE
jgi:hypothetical protein